MNVQSLLSRLINAKLREYYDGDPMDEHTINMDDVQNIDLDRAADALKGAADLLTELIVDGRQVRACLANVKARRDLEAAISEWRLA